MPKAWSKRRPSSGPTRSVSGARLRQKIADRSEAERAQRRTVEAGMRNASSGNRSKTDGHALGRDDNRLR
jgi:hypothetical protein